MKSLNEAPIGSTVFETTEQYEATVKAHQLHLNGCHRLVLQERRLKDGKPVQSESVDVQVVKMVLQKVNGAVAESAADVLGLLARDKMSGYEGRVVIVQTNANGSRDFVLQTAGRTSTGDRVEAIWVEEEFIELLESRRVPVQVDDENVGYAGRGASYEPAREVSPM